MVSSPLSRKILNYYYKSITFRKYNIHDIMLCKSVCTVYIQYLRDVIFEVFMVNCPSTTLEILSVKVWLALIGEQGTCEQLRLTLARDDGKCFPAAASE